MSRVDPSKEKLDRVYALRDKLNKAFKHTVIALADEVPYMYGLRRPSGITQLDIDTAGGLPASSVCCISGPDGAGKSDLLLRYMAWQQRLHGNKTCLALAHVEHQFDHIKARRLGLKIKVPEEHIEQEQILRKYRGIPLLTKDEVKDMRTEVGTFFIIPPADMETMLQLVIEIMRSRDFQMVGVDSISAMIPADFDNKDMDEEAKRGAHAMNLKKFYLKYYNLGSIDEPVWTTLIMTQQVTANDSKSSAPSFMQKFLPDFVSKGGHAGRHGKLIDIMLTNGGKVKVDGEKLSGDGKKEKVTTGKLVKWELTKAKAGTHEGIRGEVEFEFNTPGNIDYARTAFVAGIRYGVLKEQQGLVTWMRNGEPHPEVQRIPFKAFLDGLRNNVQLDIDIRMAIMDAAGVDHCRYHDDDAK